MLKAPRFRQQVEHLGQKGAVLLQPQSLICYNYVEHFEGWEIEFL